MDVRVQTVSTTDLMDVSDRSLNDSNIVLVAQGFINEAMEGSDVPEPGTPVAAAEVDETEEGGISKIREDGLALFKNLCKLSMKFSTPDNPEDQVLLRGKVLSLELLKMVVDNAGPFWRTNEKYDHSCSCLSYLHFNSSTCGIFNLCKYCYCGELEEYLTT